ncbi:MAG: class I SAM-dependent rRNA methyltransferase [Clostridia bacterium]|nr:class I SAM-dependent rRNA methyltransferase [Clostridia bacterium]
MGICIVKAGREKTIDKGHPWVYRSDVTEVREEPKPGDVVRVLSAKGRFMGMAIYNPNSQLTLRVLSREEEPIDEAFFHRRLQRAWDYRLRFCDPMSCRVVHSEADFLPGMIIDKFADTCVMQCLSLGMERYKESMAHSLMEITGAKGVYERNDVPVRRLEGLEESTGVLAGNPDAVVEMTENGLRFLVDTVNGQKTGYFLDQKENRAAIRPIVNGASVLDCCCHTGAFAVHAASYGAQRVEALDISPEALAMAKKNVDLNRLENVSYTEANVFDALREKVASGMQYDVVILDPPAFTKSRHMIESALRGYKEINLRAMKLVKEGGFLITCSCSQHVSYDAFMNMLVESSRDAKKQIRMIEKRGQGKDHPILPALDESQYLKCVFLQVF